MAAMQAKDPIGHLRADVAGRIPFSAMHTVDPIDSDQCVIQFGAALAENLAAETGPRWTVFVRTGPARASTRSLAVDRMASGRDPLLA